MGRVLPPDLEDSLPPTLTETLDTARNGIKRSAEIYINLCMLLERLAKRHEGLAADHLRFSLTLQSLTEATKDTYTLDSSDVPLLNDGIRSTAKHLSNSQTLLEDEARAWEDGVLEDLKQQRDCLVSMRELFDRRDRYARNNIPQLERRIEVNERKLQDLRARTTGAVKPGEIERVEESIFKVALSLLLFLAKIKMKADMSYAGQGINCPTTCTWRVHPTVSARRTRALPKEPVSHYSTTSGLEPGTSEILGAASGQLAVVERPGGRDAGRCMILFCSVLFWLLCLLCFGAVCYILLSLIISFMSVFIYAVDAIIHLSAMWSRDTAESFTSDARKWVVSGAENTYSQSTKLQVALQGWARA